MTSNGFCPDSVVSTFCGNNYIVTANEHRLMMQICAELSDPNPIGNEGPALDSWSLESKGG
jgi:hypothetical protein